MHETVPKIHSAHHYLDRKMQESTEKEMVRFTNLNSRTENGRCKGNPTKNGNTEKEMHTKKGTTRNGAKEVEEEVAGTGKSDNIFKLLENILQMEIGIIEIKFVCCFSDNNQKRTDASSLSRFPSALHMEFVEMH